MERRHFLGAALVGFVGACTQDVQLLDSEPTTTAASATERSPGATTSSLAPTTPTPVDALDTDPVALGAFPFDLGIASGDPTSGSVMLWTTLTGELPDEVPLVWEVAGDADFDFLYATGRIRTTTGENHSVRVDATGLPPASSVFYRFRVGDEVSEIGRTKTFAPAGTQVPVLRLAVSSCQARTDGAYATHRSIAGADIDAVIWLGDYIYGQSETLEEYRATYAQYRGDAALRAAHAAHPWIMIWDDHEVANDFDANVDPRRLQAGLRAWRENQPVRLPTPDETGLIGYRSFVVGDVCQILMLDARQYSSSGQSGAASILGASQQQWLLDSLDNEAAWSVIGSPVLASGLSAPVDQEGPLLPYTWDGAPQDRRELAEALADKNAIIVSGDLHTSMVLDFTADPTDPAAKPVATEFMAPSVSSQFPARFESAAPLLPLFNRHLRHIDTSNGWLLLEITPEKIVATFQFVTDVQDPESDVLPGPAYEVLLGEAEARLVT